MPVEKSIIESCSKFGSDIRRIRESKNISLTQIHEETKVDSGLLEEFEENGLATYSMFNRVYLRSLVSSYSSMIGIDKEIALGHLDQALDGSYSNGLAAEYLGEVPITIIEKGAMVDEEELELLDQPVVAAPREVSSNPIEEPPDTEIQLPATPKVVLRPDSIRRMAIILPTALALVAAVYFLGRFLLASDPSIPDDPVQVTSSDTTDSEIVEQIPVVSAYVMPDTIRLAVQPTGGDFSPIRVRVDNDLRRPYWADSGDTLYFDFVNKIRFEGRLERLNIFVFGNRYDPGRLSSRSPFTLTRPDIEGFVTVLNANR